MHATFPRGHYGAEASTARSPHVCWDGALACKCRIRRRPGPIPGYAWWVVLVGMKLPFLTDEVGKQLASEEHHHSRLKVFPTPTLPIQILLIIHRCEQVLLNQVPAYKGICFAFLLPVLAHGGYLVRQVWGNVMVLSSSQLFCFLQNFTDLFIRELELLRNFWFS